jgi:hypothetical protein
MAKNETIFFTKEGRFAEASGSTLETVITAGLDGSKLLDLRYTEEVSGTVTEIRIQVNGVTIGEFTPVVGDQLLNAEPIDKSGNKYLNLPAGAIVTMLPTGGNARVMGYVEDY